MKYDFLVDRKKILVSAQIESIDDCVDFKFILDTGASTTIISENVAIRLGFDLKSLETGDRLMTAGGSMHSKTLTLSKLRLFGKDMINFEVNVLKLPPQITYFADGLIGMDFLLQFKNIKFDFETKTITLHEYC